MSQAKYYLLLLLVCLIWGATPASGKYTVEAFSPLLITGTRFAIMAALLFLWMVLTKDTKDLLPDLYVLKIAACMGFMGVLVHNGLLFYGLSYTTATNTALIESIGPTATTLLSFFFIGERLTKLGWLGIAISCVGAITIVSKGSLEVLTSLSFNVGDIMILICEIAWSAYVVISWRINGKCGTIAITAWSGLFGSLFCYATGLVTGSLHIYEVTPHALYGFTYLVLCSGLFAFVAWNYAVQYVGAAKSGVFIYLVPITGGIVGVTVLGEEVLPAQIIGAIIIISGVVITVRSKVQIKEAKKAQAQSVGKPTGDEENLLERFPELAKKHNEKLAKQGVTLPSADDLARPLSNAMSAPYNAASIASGADNDAASHAHEQSSAKDCDSKDEADAQQVSAADKINAAVAAAAQARASKQE